MLKKQKTKHETAKDDFQTKMFLLSIICAHTPLKLLLNKIFKKKVYLAIIYLKNG